MEKFDIIWRKTGGGQPYKWSLVDNSLPPPYILRHESLALSQGICLLIVDDKASDTAGNIVGGAGTTAQESHMKEHIFSALNKGIWVCCCDFEHFGSKIGLNGAWTKRIPMVLESFVKSGRLIVLLDIYKGEANDEGPCRRILSYLKNSNPDMGVCWAIERSKIAYYTKNPRKASSDDGFEDYVAKDISERKKLPQDCMTFNDWLEDRLDDIHGWTGDKICDDFINNVFLAPLAIDAEGWPHRWSHDECQEKATERTVSAIMADFFGIDPKKYDTDLTKALIMLPGMKSCDGVLEGWVHEQKKNYNIISLELRKILNKLDLNKIEIEGEDNEPWTLPIIPATPFMVSLKQYFNELSKKPGNDFEYTEDIKHLEGGERRGFVSAVFKKVSEWCILEIKFPESRIKGKKRKPIPNDGLKIEYDKGKTEGLAGALRNLVNCQVIFNNKQSVDCGRHPWMKYFHRGEGGITFNNSLEPIRVEWPENERTIQLMWKNKED